MSNMKRNALLILLAMLILVTVPMSFASDINATDLGTADAPSDVVQYVDEDVVSDSEHGFYIHENDIEINEGESATIVGEIMGDGQTYYGELNFKYSYVDSNGITQSKNVAYDAFDETEYTITISDLTAANSPYIVTFSVIDDDAYEEYLWYADEIPDETVTITVIGTNTPIEDPALPEYTTITPEGQLYVDDGDGNDENDGSEAAPFKTIQAALDKNSALGGNYEIIVNAGTYNVAGYTISKPVRINGRGEVIIDAQQTNYHFSVSANTVEFYNLVFINGKSTLIGSLSGSSTGGGSGNTGKVLNIINCTFKDNSGMIGVMRTYATTTILNSNFISNTATGSSTGWGNIIYCAENTLTVRFSNFIDNTVKSGKTVIDAVEKSNANYNFWGSNNGPSSSDVGDKVTAKAWVILDATLDATTLKAGNDYTITLKNKYVKGEETGDLTIPMADLDVDLSAEEGTIAPATVIVSNNLGEATYTAPNSPDDAITVKAYSTTLKTINVDDIAVLLYIVTPNPDSVNYVKGESCIVTFTFEYPDSLDFDYVDIAVFIDGSNWKSGVVDADSYDKVVSIDLADYDDELDVGTHTVVVRHTNDMYDTNWDVLGPRVCQFNAVTVTVSEPVYDYESTPDPVVVNDYVIGNDKLITVTVNSDYLSSLTSESVYAWINGEGTINRYLINGVKGSDSSFTFNLADISSKLKEGENTITFHVTADEYSTLYQETYGGNFNFNTLTVNALKLVGTNIAAEDLIMAYKDGSSWAVTLTDADGSAISNAVVKIGLSINGVDKVYNRKTDANGVASLAINLVPGSYAVNATFDGDDTYAGSFAEATVTVNPAAPIFVGEDLVMAYKDGSSWAVTLTDADGSAISNAVVKIGLSINGVDKVYNRKTDANGVASLPINLAPGSYAVNATFDGNNKCAAAFVNATVTVTKAALTVSADDVTMGYKDGSSYKVNVADAEGNAVANIKVKFTLGTANYNIKTDANGVAELPINLALGTYTISATVNEAYYESNEISNAIAVTTSNLAITANDVNMTYKDGTAYEVQLVDGNGNPIALANQIVKITVKDKSYNRKTDINGIASLPINLAAGTYDITAEYNGIELTNIVTVTKA